MEVGQQSVRIWEYEIKVVGISHYIGNNSELLSDDVVCEREPTNPKDPNAIAVYSVLNDQRKKIGFLARQFAMSIPDRDLPVRGKITWRAPTLGVRIEI